MIRCKLRQEIRGGPKYTFFARLPPYFKLITPGFVGGQNQVLSRLRRKAKARNSHPKRRSQKGSSLLSFIFDFFGKRLRSVLARLKKLNKEREYIDVFFLNHNAYLIGFQP